MSCQIKNIPPEALYIVGTGNRGGGFQKEPICEPLPQPYIPPPPLLSATATFFSAGGAPTPPNRTGLVPFLVTNPSPPPTKEGYVFTGWIRPLPRVIYYNQSFTAQWDEIPLIPISVSAIFDAAFGSPTPAVQSGLTPFDVSVPTQPTRPGYFFIDWSPQVPSTIARNTTFVAQWAEGVTATFDSNGGTPVSSQTGSAPLLVTTPSEPTKVDYTFLRWEPQVPTSIDTDTTFTAIWNANIVECYLAMELSSIDPSYGPDQTYGPILLDGRYVVNPGDVYPLDLYISAPCVVVEEQCYLALEENGITLYELEETGDNFLVDCLQ